MKAPNGVAVGNGSRMGAGNPVSSGYVYNEWVGRERDGASRL